MESFDYINFYSSIRSAKGFHYPDLKNMYTASIDVQERLNYLNDHELIAFHISEEEMNNYNLPNNTIWINYDDYYRARTKS